MSVPTLTTITSVTTLCQCSMVSDTTQASVVPSNSVTILSSTSSAAVFQTLSPFHEVAGSSKANSGKVIGISVGVPIGVICVLILVFLALYRWRKWLLLHKYNYKSNRFRRLSRFLHRKQKGQNVDEENRKYSTIGNPISMNIQYRISRPTRHIFTPKAIHPSTNKDGHWLSEKTAEEQAEANDTALLDQSTSNKATTAPVFERFSDTLTKDNRKYTGFSVASPIPYLKKLDILSHKHVNNSNLIEDERSPILEKIEDDAHIISESEISTGGYIKLDSPSAIYGTIGIQAVGLDSNSSRIIKLDPAPNKERGFRKHKLVRNKLVEHLDRVANMKPLPPTPQHLVGKDIVIGRIYKAVNEFHPRLPDEIHLSIAEYLRVLATRSDGWCLVERCGPDGRSKDNALSSNIDVSGDQYLNDNRGIVPANCLEELKEECK